MWPYLSIQQSLHSVPFIDMCLQEVKSNDVLTALTSMANQKVQYQSLIYYSVYLNIANDRLSAHL